MKVFKCLGFFLGLSFSSFSWASEQQKLLVAGDESLKAGSHQGYEEPGHRTLNEKPGPGHRTLNEKPGPGHRTLNEKPGPGHRTLGDLEKELADEEKLSKPGKLKYKQRAQLRRLREKYSQHGDTGTETGAAATGPLDFIVASSGQKKKSTEA